MKIYNRHILGLFALLLSAIPITLSAQQKLTLTECRTLALERNKIVKVSENEIQIAGYNKKTARTYYLPKVYFTGNWLHNNSSVNLLDHDMFLPVVPYNVIDPETQQFLPATLTNPEIASKTFVINPLTHLPVMDENGIPVFKNYAYIPKDGLKFTNQNSYYLRFTVTQPVFTGLKITEANRIANHMENISNKSETLTKSEIISKTDEAFWRVVQVGEKVKVAHSYETLLDRLVTDLENMYAEGIITSNDVLKARVKQNDAKLSVLKAEDGYALSKMALAQIIGLNEEDVDVDMGNLEEIPEELPKSMYGEPLPDERAEIAILNERVAIKKANKNIVRSKFMPNILMTGGYSWMRPDLYNGFNKSFGNNWNVGLTLTIPIFTWGERINNFNAAKLGIHNAQLELNETGEKITLQIKQNRYKYTETLKKIELTKLSKEQAEENMREQRENLLVGQNKLTDLLEAQTLWVQASYEHIDALIELRTTLLDLDKSTGEIYNYFE